MMVLFFLFVVGMLACMFFYSLGAVLGSHDLEEFVMEVMAPITFMVGSVALGLFVFVLLLRGA